MKKYLILISAAIFSVQIIGIWTAYDNRSNLTSSITAIPDFSLPSLYSKDRMIGSDDLNNNNIRVINFFASWCGPCKVEHPHLMELTQNKVEILGINFQDNPELAKNFLKSQGNPYLLSAVDPAGELGPQWNITSIPQTFIINETGQVIFHKSGRLTGKDIKDRIQPLLTSMKD